MIRFLVARVRGCGFLLAFTVALPLAASAEPATLRETLLYAREHAPHFAIRAAERDRVRADARVRGFWLPEPPEVAGEWTERDAPDGSHAEERMLEASMALDPFGLVFRSRSAGAGRNLGLREVDTEARAWAAGVAWLYHERLRRHWMHDRRLQQAEVTQRLLDVVRQRVDAGDASGLELDLARVEASEGKRRVFESEGAKHRASELLAAAIGWPAGMELPAPGSLELVPSFPDTANLFVRTLEQRPQLLAAEAALSRGKAEAQLARARLLPEAEFGVFDGEDDGDEVRGLRLALSVPFLGPPLVETGAHSAEKRRLEAEMRAATRDAFVEVAVAQAATAVASQQVALYVQEILPGIQGARQRYQEAYSVGQVDLATILVSEQRYRDAEHSFAEVLGTYIDALRELELATGLPLFSGYSLEDESNR